MKWIILTVTVFVIQQFLPWWSIALAGLFYGFIIRQSTLTAILNGFTGVFVLWAGIPLYIYFVNDGLLASVLAVMFYLPHGLLAVLAGGLAGGITGALSSLAGKYLRDLSNLKPIALKA
ncbi:MAG: hypothetical protein ACOCX0_01200 [Bacteroidota bacterium]